MRLLFLSRAVHQPIWYLASDEVKISLSYWRSSIINTISQHFSKTSNWDACNVHNYTCIDSKVVAPNVYESYCRYITSFAYSLWLRLRLRLRFHHTLHNFCLAYRTIPTRKVVKRTLTTNCHCVFSRPVSRGRKKYNTPVLTPTETGERCPKKDHVLWMSNKIDTQNIDLMDSCYRIFSGLNKISVTTPFVDKTNNIILSLLPRGLPPLWLMATFWTTCWWLSPKRMPVDRGGSCYESQIQFKKA
jgi:hypothetical protein